MALRPHPQTTGYRDGTIDMKTVIFYGFHIMKVQQRASSTDKATACICL